MGLITQPSVLDDNSVTNANSATTASVTPKVNRLLVVFVYNALSSSGSANLPALSGLGITWTEITSHASSFSSGQYRVTMFVGVLTAAQTGALTISFSGQSQKGINWIVLEFPQNVYVNAANPQNAILQTASAESNGANSSLTVSLSSFANPNNATLGAIRKDGQNAISVGGSFTNLASVGGGGNDGLCNAEFAGNNQTSVNWTWTSDTTSKVAIAAEVKCLVMGAGGLLLL